ncbi:ABC-F family ATP-binding cassette domain-containing protein [Dactylosporangium sp. NPDC048998]|uniref:ABC-F family ATP-binding cassette domain-containing protein n=1 Tax=Dactylosporangium sp. NPDC048998 TaxID=3363976 RepID=UPI00371BB356
MAATLVVKDLAAGHGDKALFTGLDLVVAPGDVVGLVGVNGAGKSTLLRTLAGLLPVEQGAVQLNPPTATIGYLPQEPDRRPGETLRAFLARRTGVAEAQARLDAAAEALTGGDAAAEEYSAALERWLALGGADLDERAGEVAADLGLAVDLDLEMTALSGGQAARAGLASLLLSRYDILLLDEPTNDLDLNGLDRIEGFVNGQKNKSVIVVSHDREFLARSTTAVLELDLHQHQVNFYGGGYEAYLQERATARRHARERYEDYADTRADLEARARMQRAWMEKGVKNARRKQSDNDKIGKSKKIESTEKQAAKARQTERLIERLEMVEEPRKEWQLRMEIAAAPRAGAVVATLHGAVVRRGAFTLGPVDLQVDWADRIAITGANGSGKTTLLGALLGRLPLDEGRAYLGPGVVVGEVDQARRMFEGTESLLDAFRLAVPEQNPADVRTLLAKFGLKADHVVRPASSLSPGERTRAALALLQGKGVNCLVLDEPTNHLDLPAIEQLESALETYPGTLLLVTHDRRMLEAVRTDRHVHVEAGKVTAA